MNGTSETCGTVLKGITYNWGSRSMRGKDCGRKDT